MAFALYFNGFELEILRQVMVVAAADRTINAQQRRFAQDVLDAGLTNWSTAPLETGPRAAGDVDCRRLVLNTTITLQSVLDYLRSRRFVVQGDGGDRYPYGFVKDIERSHAGGEQL